ncbi:hypothetical protein HDU76_005484 [Blyttiomyces sp. JEL0837]|nr:hypothetical protein HDU76_005484 [Blyttiomyces sp. JEL0837]
MIPISTSLAQSLSSSVSTSPSSASTSQSLVPIPITTTITTIITSTPHPFLKSSSFHPIDAPNSPTIINPSTSTTSSSPSNTYKLSWYDNFNTETLNTTTWNYENGLMVAKLATASINNVYVCNDLLHLECKSGDFVTDLESGVVTNFTVGRVYTKRTFGFGFWEARVKVTDVAGFRFAFWICQGIPNAPFTELDVITIDSAKPNIATSGIWQHWSNQTASRILPPTSYTTNNNLSLANEFHVYGAEWLEREDLVRFYFDGVVMGVQEWPKEAPRFTEGYVLLTVSVLKASLPSMPVDVGGGNNGTGVPVPEVLVDYVAYYELSPGGGGGGAGGNVQIAQDENLKSSCPTCHGDLIISSYTCDDEGTPLPTHNNLGGRLTDETSMLEVTRNSNGNLVLYPDPIRGIYMDDNADTFNASHFWVGFGRFKYDKAAGRNVGSCFSLGDRGVGELKITGMAEVGTSFEVHVVEFDGEDGEACVDEGGVMVFQSRDFGEFLGMGQYVEFTIPINQPFLKTSRLSHFIITNITPPSNSLTISCITLLKSPQPTIQLSAPKTTTTPTPTLSPPCVIQCPTGLLIDQYPTCPVPAPASTIRQPQGKSVSLRHRNGQNGTTGDDSTSVSVRFGVDGNPPDGELVMSTRSDGSTYYYSSFVRDGVCFDNSGASGAKRRYDVLNVVAAANVGGSFSVMFSELTGDCLEVARWVSVGNVGSGDSVAAFQGPGKFVLFSTDIINTQYLENRSYIVVSMSNMYSLIPDGTSPNLCWDASTLAIGAQVSLHDCNPVAATQAFLIQSGVGYDQSSVALSVAVDSVNSLCVELNGNSSILTLAPCEIKSSQAFNFDTTGNVTLNNGTICAGPLNTDTVDRHVIAQIPCNQNSTKIVQPFISVDPPISFPPYAITQLQIADLCLDGSNITNVKATTCSGAPSQDWYHLWGQIRNVENGLCIDVPNPKTHVELSTYTAPVSMSPCHHQPPSPTMLWIKQHDNSLQNSVSANCMRLLDDNTTIVLGTATCNDTDILASRPKVFKGVEALVVELYGTGSKCVEPVQRKDVRDLSPVEVQDFFKGMNALRKIPSLMGRANRYIDYVSLHGIAVNWIHKTPHFLSWHRYYLALLESDLRQILNNQSFAFPYWAWGTSSTTWFEQSAGVLTPEMFGTTGSANSSYCVNDGFMKGSWVPSNGAGCLIRSYNVSADALNERVALYSEEYLLAIVNVNPNTNSTYQEGEFDAFRKIVETVSTRAFVCCNPHNSMHNAIGGRIFGAHMGNPSISVNDPIFWLHHANIDRYWKYWQHANPSLANTYNGQRVVPPFTKNVVNVTTSDILVGFNVDVAAGMGYYIPGQESLNDGSYCHTYIPYSKSFAFINLNNVNETEYNFVRRQSQNLRGRRGVTHRENNLSIPNRVLPSPIEDSAFELPWMKDLNVIEVREMERNSISLLKHVWDQTDLIMDALFDANVSTVSFKDYAVSVHHAIKKIAAHGGGKV